MAYNMPEMTNAFEDAYLKISELAKDFGAQKHFYISPSYTEAQVRGDFIDKLLTALGWDVAHNFQKNPFEQEVTVEKNVEVGARQRRADYAFCLAPNFRDVRFYVEAKKPFGGLASKDNYFQTIRYGWNSQTPIAVLTDFAEFHVVDCRYKPDIDTALEHSILTFHYSDYADKEKFSKIYYLFSREAVNDGSLEKFAQTLLVKRGKAVQRGLFKGGYQSIDEAFIEELDEHRDALARSFKNKNPNLDSDTLTEITQRTLDRLVFLRFIEDKLIETHESVSNFGAKGTVWGDFRVASHRLNSIYNGIVFKEHSVLDSKEFKVDDHVFGDVCEKLSDKNSPYDFNIIPIHILGSIYERFLGKVIVATGKRASVKEKPGVRKAGGVYYTPEYIVRCIVESTVEKLIAGKTPVQITQMHFADIACGSGSFLIGIYDSLLRYHRNWYNVNPNKAKAGDCIKHDDGTLHLSLEKKREILINNIYGVDIDPQAVEVAQLSLYLKLLEEETTASVRYYQFEIHQTLLPSLAKNIVCGNSIIGPDVLEGRLFTEEEEPKLNPMKFEDRFPEIMKHGGFDVVIGNPPYVDSEEMVKSHPITRGYCSERYKTAKGNWDMYCVFSEKAVSLLNDTGYYGYIIPNKFLSAPYGEHLKRFFSTYEVNQLADYSGVSVFKSNGKKISVYPIVIILSKGRANRSGTYYKMIEDTLIRCAYQKDFSIAAGEVNWTEKFDPLESLITKVEKQSVDISNHFIIENPATVSEAYELKKIIGDDATAVKGNFMFVNTGTIDRYENLWGQFKTQYIKGFYDYPYVPKEKLKKSFPRRYEQTISEKLILAGMIKRIEAMYDSGKIVAGKSTLIIMNKTKSYSLKYLLALINSKLFSTIYQSKFKYSSMAGGYLNVSKGNLSKMPFKELSLSDNAQKAQYEHILVLVQQTLGAKEKLSTAKTDRDKTYYENRCTDIDRQIDRVVYNLYGLTEEQISTVEGNHLIG